VKLSRTSWLLLAGGIIVIALISLGFARMQQLNEQERLEEELEIASKRIETLELQQLTARQETLDSQLIESEAQFQYVADIMTPSFDSISISDFLFEVAEATHVEIIEISTSSVQNIKIDEVFYPTLPIDIVVEGRVDHIVGFIISLNDSFASGIVSSVNVDIPEDLVEDVPSASITLIIYGYQGG